MYNNKQENLNLSKVSRRSLRAIKHTDLISINEDGLIHLTAYKGYVFAVTPNTFHSIKSNIKVLSINKDLLILLQRELQFYSKEQYVARFGEYKYNLLSLSI